MTDERSIRTTEKSIYLIKKIVAAVPVTISKRNSFITEKNITTQVIAWRSKIKYPLIGDNTF